MPSGSIPSTTKKVNIKQLYQYPLFISQWIHYHNTILLQSAKVIWERGDGPYFQEAYTLIVEKKNILPR